MPPGKFVAKNAANSPTAPAAPRRGATAIVRRAHLKFRRCADDMRMRFEKPISNPTVTPGTGRTAPPQHPDSGDIHMGHSQNLDTRQHLQRHPQRSDGTRAFPADGSGGGTGGKLLFVLTSHETLGKDGGEPTGFHLAEAARP